MEVIRGLGVNDLYYNGLELLRLRGQKEETRNGPALVYPTPVTTVYRDPTHRVLFDAKRNANPFFHLYESLWMLAGRYDANGLNVFVSNFGQRFAELGGTVHGAYGQRWRAALGYDQLAVIIKRLQDNPNDRQCVLQMWDATDKPEALAGYRGYNDLRGNWKDRPCNTHVYFRVRSETMTLDMTILCRSNDIIWGAYGANAVHFSMLQEYIAGMIGVEVGTMYQVSNNFHAYEDALAKVGQPELHTYRGLDVKPMPIMTSPQDWDADLERFMAWTDRHDTRENGETYKNNWFDGTATNIMLAHWLWKSAMRKEAVSIARLIEAEDWRLAVLQWFERRGQVHRQSNVA